MNRQTYRYGSSLLIGVFTFSLVWSLLILGVMLSAVPTVRPGQVFAAVFGVGVTGSFVTIMAVCLLSLVVPRVAIDDERMQGISLFGQVKVNERLADIKRLRARYGGGQQKVEVEFESGSVISFTSSLVGYQGLKERLSKISGREYE